MHERRLIDYLPNILKEIDEYKHILAAGETEIQLLFAAKNDVLKNQFIEDSTEIGVKRWEKMLEINPKNTLTLNERKFTILTKLNEELPYTLITLNNRLLNLCGSEDNYSITINYNDYYIKVLVGLRAKSNFNDIVNLLENIIPANMIIDCIVKYNQHINLAKYTHKELSQYNIMQIKEDVLHGNKYN